MKKFKIALSFLGVFASAQSIASTLHVENKIAEIFMWEKFSEPSVAQLSRTAIIVFGDANSTKCHVSLDDEPELYSIALAALMAQNTVGMHCHDTTEDIGGFNSHPVHRIQVKAR